MLKGEFLNMSITYLGHLNTTHHEIQINPHWIDKVYSWPIPCNVHELVCSSLGFVGFLGKCVQAYSKLTTIFFSKKKTTSIS